MTFNVIDPKAGEYPDLEQIARTEEWAKNLIPCDIEGFCINEDGNLILMDECGNYTYCPPDRFKVTFDFPVYSGGGLTKWGAWLNISVLAFANTSGNC